VAVHAGDVERLGIKGYRTRARTHETLNRLVPPRGAQAARGRGGAVHARWRRGGAAAVVEGGAGRSARTRSRLTDQYGLHVGAKVYLHTQAS
jgi:hypothetical protein